MKANRKIFKCIFFITFTISFCISCNDDELVGDRGKSSVISFTASDMDCQWANALNDSRSSSMYSADNRSEVLSLSSENTSEKLYLHSTISDGIEPLKKDSSIMESRSYAITKDNFYDEFGVTAYNYSGEWNETLNPKFMCQQKATRISGTDDYTLQKTYKWPNDKSKLRFYAYAPSNLRASSSSTAGRPYIGWFDVQKDASKQVDVVYAQSEDLSGNYCGPVQLSFKHILTAVKFVTSPDVTDGRITNVLIKGVTTCGRYTFGDDSWYLNGTGYCYAAVDVGTNKGDEPVTSESQTFMMIPQTLPKGASVEITYLDNKTKTTWTLSASLEGKEWPMGKTVTYKISASEFSYTPVLAVSDSVVIDYLGNAKPYEITNYLKNNSNGVTGGTSLTYEYSEDNGKTWSSEKPDFITKFDTCNAKDTYSNNSFNIKLKAAGAEYYNPENEIIKKNPVVTNYDLSTKGGSNPVNTANCYIINSAGTYTFPLVYGNAIKNGVDNEDAYTSTISDPSYLKTFLNHLNAPITSPNIYENANCAPANAVLVWEDAKGIIKDVALTSDKHSISFSVPQSSVQQGNAIIAVRDAENRVMWSWHIWITNYVPGLPTDKDDRNRDKDVDCYLDGNNTMHSCVMMPINLGYCTVEQEIYKRREVLIRIKQAYTGLMDTLRVIQKPNTIISRGNNTYYQYGRKDPMMPVLFYGAKKACYSESGMEYDVSSDRFDIGESIQHPNLFALSSNDNWCKKSYNNLWSSNGTAENECLKIMKTIYDPSPAGYCIPFYGAFLNLCGGTVLDNHNPMLTYYPYTNINTTTTNVELGAYCRYIYGHPENKSEGMIYFPLNSMLNGGTGNYINYYVKNFERFFSCYMYKANYIDGNKACAFSLDNDRKYSARLFYSSTGCSIRAIKEQ